MLLPTTETLPRGDVIDALAVQDAVSMFVDGQQAALDSLRKAAGEIDAGAGLMADAISGDASVVYAAAGSSGLMALADACELPGTFGVPAERIRIYMAGGVPVDGRMPGNTEDETADAEAVAQGVKAGDVVIVLSASGTTPYAVHLAQMARRQGARIIALANNPATPLLALADVAICLATPPEVVAGSTRLGAGTAQKAALNLMSTLMGIRLGHVYQGRMVNVVADNIKLTRRATEMVAHIAEVTTAVAQHALAQADGQVKIAILVASGATVAGAGEMLAANGGHLGRCIENLNTND